LGAAKEAENVFIKINKYKLEDYYLALYTALNSSNELNASL
jgi:hypothetical protein